MLLAPLPYRDADMLVMIWESRPQAGDDMAPVSGGNFTDWRARVTAFEDIGWSRDAMFSLTGMGQPESLIGYRFSPNFLRVMGVQPMLGRGFRDEDDKPGAARVVILSHALWQRRFNGDSNAIGRSIMLSGEPNTIIGVMPPDLPIRRTRSCGRRPAFRPP